MNRFHIRSAGRRCCHNHPLLPNPLLPNPLLPNPLLPNPLLRAGHRSYPLEPTGLPSRKGERGAVLSTGSVRHHRSLARSSPRSGRRRSRWSVRHSRRPSSVVSKPAADIGGRPRSGVKPSLPQGPCWKTLRCRRSLRHRGLSVRPGLVGIGRKASVGPAASLSRRVAGRSPFGRFADRPVAPADRRSSGRCCNSFGKRYRGPSP
jgi:hypothetical protein